jgi:hypothetical protein
MVDVHDLRRSVMSSDQEEYDRLQRRIDRCDRIMNVLAVVIVALAVVRVVVGLGTGVW